MGCGTFLRRITRTQKIGSISNVSELRRCLGTVDLVFLGLASMIGSGVFVVGGDIAKNIAGPAVGLSFLFCGIMCALSAWSFAEFGTMVPTAGSAFTYTYIALGELIAFVVGWNVVLELCCANAVLSRTFMAYLNQLTNNYIDNKTPSILKVYDFSPCSVAVLAFAAIVICFGKTSAPTGKL